MTTLSHAELVLLALLAEGPMHAYELVQCIGSMEIERWARVPESTLYAVLHRLEERGWVTATEEPGARRRTKTTYERTAAGEARLAELVTDALESPAPIHSDLLVGAVFAASAGREDALAEAGRNVDAAIERLGRALANERLSDYGRVILEFYLGLARLHGSALASLGRLAAAGADAAPPAPSIPDSR